jgi:hypothetical protein
VDRFAVRVITTHNQLKENGWIIVEEAKIEFSEYVGSA